MIKILNIEFLPYFYILCYNLCSFQNFFKFNLVLSESVIEKLNYFFENSNLLSIKLMTRYSN